MEALKKVFQEKNQTVSMALSGSYVGSQPAQTSPALVTFVTAGYPKVEDTVPILLSMQEGEADIIELGVPFSDPIADGPAIQETNVVRTRHVFPILLLTSGTMFRSHSITTSTTHNVSGWLGMRVTRDLLYRYC